MKKSKFCLYFGNIYISENLIASICFTYEMAFSIFFRIYIDYGNLLGKERKSKTQIQNPVKHLR